MLDATWGVISMVPSLKRGASKTGAVQAQLQVPSTAAKVLNLGELELFIAQSEDHRTPAWLRDESNSSLTLMDEITRQPLLSPQEEQDLAVSIQSWRRRFHEELFASPRFICHAVPILIQEFKKDGIAHLFKILQMSNLDVDDNKTTVVTTASTNVEMIRTLFDHVHKQWQDECPSLDAPQSLALTSESMLTQIANYLLAISMRPEYILSLFSDCKRLIETAQLLKKGLHESSSTEEEIGTQERARQERPGSLDFPISWATYESLDDGWSAVCHAYRCYYTAKEILFSRNMRLANSWARKYLRPGANLEDLKQEGYRGLMTAVERFDPEREIRFSTFAVICIKSSISLYIDRSLQLVRHPRDVLQHMREVDRFVEDFRKRNVRSPTPEEIVRELQKRLPRVTVEWLQSYFFTHGPTVSLDNHGADGDSGRGLGENIADKRYSSTDVADNNERNSALINEVDKALNGLRERDRTIFYMRYGLKGHTQMTLEEVARQFSLDRERIRQIQNRALAILKRALPRNLFDTQ